MKKIIFFLFLFSGFLLSQALAQELKLLGPFNKDDRLLIFAPHPDDETIGCGGIIQQALKSGAEVKIVYLTNGDHNELAFIVYEKRLTFRKGEFIHMGQVRRQEAVKAMQLLGLPEENLIFLGYPDFGTFSIFSQYWQTNKPFKSALTRISSVPYKNNPSFGSSYTGESILSDIKKVLSDYKPTKIFVSHPLDVNVDHKSLYLFLQVALRDLEKQIPKPEVFPYLVHCVGWPSPRHYHPELNLEPPKNLLDSQINWTRYILSQEQLKNKHKAILAYNSQTRTSAFYLLSFARKNELFSDYPEIELNKQVSLKEQAPVFFGFSKMFDNIEDEGAFTDKGLIEAEGQVSYAIADNCILIRVQKPKEMIKRFRLILYVFGYSDKVPFAAMPKIRIITKHDKFKVYDGKRLIEPTGMKMDFNHHEIILRIPLDILGNPNFILTSVKAYGNKLSLDSMGYRKIVIK